MARALRIIPHEPERRRSIPRSSFRKEYWNDQFNTVKEIVEEWGYDVIAYTKAQEHVDIGGDKTIHINSSCHPETRFYTLLHEVGHILVRRDWKRFSRDYPNYLDSPYIAVDGRREKRKSYRIGLIAEEIEAWKRGRNFAQRRKLYVDPLKYDFDANAALMSYINWISDISRNQVLAGRKAAKTRATRSRTRPRTRPRA